MLGKRGAASASAAAASPRAAASASEAGRTSKKPKSESAEHAGAAGASPVRDASLGGESSAVTWQSLGLKPALLRSILAFGFESPSQVQQLAILPIIRGRDVIVQSQSGTGKTAVFCIAVLQVIKEKERHAQALLLSPTRELAEQTAVVVKNLGDALLASVRTCIGGKLLKEDVKALQQGTQIISGTPGRVYDVIKRGVLEVRRVVILVIDEADDMITSKSIITDIYRQLSAGVQVVLVSATMTGQVLEMSRDFMTEPHRVLVKREDLSLDGITQYHARLSDGSKFDALCDLYHAIPVQQAVFFCNTRKRVDWLTAKLRSSGFSVSSMHGDMDQKERDAVMAQFRLGASRALCTTDVWGRGIDVQQVTLVVNFDMPPSKELYLHRIGRSGRWGRKGLAISFCTDDDADMLRAIEKHYRIRIATLPRDPKALVTG